MSISHNFADESLDKKAEWFRALSLQQRMNVFVEFSDLVLNLNPNAGKKNVEPPSDRIRVLALP